MGDFRFWIESDAWRVSFCFRSLYIAAILWNNIQDRIGSIFLVMLFLNIDKYTFHWNTWRIDRNNWRVALFIMSLSPHQNLTALMERYNWSKIELLSKVWLVSNDKLDKITIPQYNLMLISISYKVILFIGSSVLLRGFKLGDEVLDVYGVDKKL